MRGHRGSLSAMSVCLVLSVMALVGLVFDGGANVNEYMRLSDIAENAARVGAQEIVGIRAGDAHIDSRKAAIACKNYLRSYGVAGSVSITRESVMVAVEGDVTFQILSIIGLSGRHLRVVRTAGIVAG
ncbi:unannotated protein [freshwater metagenome]|uniref:Unannotated protein n=1 Tax=freshwater metagenome TaxID=449393 RepID=A0A6J6HGS1_9ZZZZ|nr:hypothetical protein [Actinomycetota bacterium]